MKKTHILYNRLSLFAHYYRNHNFTYRSPKQNHNFTYRSPKQNHNFTYRSPKQNRSCGSYSAACFIYVYLFIFIYLYLYFIKYFQVALLVSTIQHSSVYPKPTFSNLPDYPKSFQISVGFYPIKFLLSRLSEFILRSR